MQSTVLTWLPFMVNLDSVESHLRQTYPAYVGNSADVALTLWFSEQPSDDDLAAIQAYWSGLTEESPEVTSYVPATTLAAQIAALKAGLVTKTWDEMTVTERKLATNQPVTRSDLGL